MTNPFPRFQNPHNRRLGFVIPVRGDTFVSFFILGLRFFELNGVDFDAVFWVSEGCVERECVGGVDFAAFGMFGQRSDFGACEGLECAV
jgi:hypothetical protein